MYCRSCKVRMRELRRSFHKQRKWVCPRCGRVRMQRLPSRQFPAGSDKR